MKINNFLALGLIAVVSGISTAQTYNATAGTNGVTDIQSDYSMATGDGASVSVDVPLEFELPKKVAIAVSPTGTTTLPANPMFDGITPNTWPTTYGSSAVVDLTPYDNAGNNNISKNRVGVAGGIYANTAFSVTSDFTPFEHESDPNSIIKAANRFLVFPKTGVWTVLGGASDNNDSATSAFPKTSSISDTVLADNDNQLSFVLYSYAYLDTIEPTDRAGKYISTATITVSTL